jgi:ABC-type oligopeptide transport system substrate-binding subunit
VRRVLASVAMLAAGSLLLATAGLASRDHARRSATGGTLRIATPRRINIDPAFAADFVAWWFDDATCALLMHYPDRGAAPADYGPVLGAAAGLPKVSRDGKTYTFTVRRGIRFSDGKTLTASNFARAIERDLSPVMDTGAGPDWYGLDTVAGAEAYAEGKAKAVSGVRAAGYRLTFQLTRPTPDFLARMAIPFLCPVSLTLPFDPEGANAPLPGSGPYYIAAYVRDERIVLKPNPNYHGSRRPHLGQIVITLGADQDDIVDAVKRNQIDATGNVPTERYAELANRYGINRARFRLFPTPVVYYVYFNTAGRLFRNNARLRRAINFALDRRRLVRQGGFHWGNTTDQYLPPRFPGFRNAHVYPLKRPDLARARALAKGHLRNGRALLYAPSGGDGIYVRWAQVVRENLSKIGIRVEIKTFPLQAYYKAFGEGKWDLIVESFDTNWIDPSPYLEQVADRARFTSPRFAGQMQRADALGGGARYRAYGSLDIDLARTAAPAAAWGVFNGAMLFSSRVGCVAYNQYYGWDLAAACLPQ